MNHLMNPYRNPQRRERLLNLAEFRVAKTIPAQATEAMDSDEGESAEGGSDGGTGAMTGSAGDQV